VAFDLLLMGLALVAAGCSYQDRRLSYPSLAALERPFLRLGEVRGAASAYSAEVAVGQALLQMDDQARALEADDIGDVRVSVDTTLGLLRLVGIPTCHAEVHGMAVRYGKKLE
jgi:hypothetical protein